MALHDRSVFEGDKITYVARDGRLVFGAVVKYATDGAIVITVVGLAHQPFRLQHSGEGTYWGRGHFSSESSTGAALLASYALARCHT